MEFRLFSGLRCFDVIFPTSGMQFYKIQKFLLPLDCEKIPNSKKINPKILEKFSVNLKGKPKALPYLIGTTGIAYYKDALLKCYPEAALDSWSLFFDPKVLEGVSPCRVGVMDSFLDVFQGALLYLGKDPNSQIPSDWEAAFKVIQGIRPFLADIGSFQTTNNLVQGNLDAVLGFSNEILMAKSYDPSSKLHYALPKEGGKLWSEMMAIPKNAPHPEHAYRFINFLLRPENIAILSNHLYIGNPVPESLPFINAELLDNPWVFPSDEAIDKLFIEKKLSKKSYKKALKYWFSLKMKAA